MWKYEATEGVPGFSSKTASVTVAVKTLRSNATEGHKRDLLNELAMMKMLDPHPNVVRLLGCCTEKGAYYLQTGPIEFNKRNVDRLRDELHFRCKILLGLLMHS